MASASLGGRKRLRFATFLAPNLYPIYDFIAAYIGDQLNLPVEIAHVPTHDQFLDVAADVSFICGLPYVYLARETPRPVDLIAAPVLIGERYQNRPVYFSDVIVRADSDLQTFGDLRGRSWAYNEVVSQSGYGITRHALLQMTATDGFFGRVVNARSHQNAIRLVASGKIDGAAIDSQVLAVEFESYPQFRQQLRIIDSLGPSPIQPVVADRTLPETLKLAVREAICRMGDDPAARKILARGFFKGFVPVTDRDYDPIRVMLRQAEDADFLYFH